MTEEDKLLLDEGIVKAISDNLSVEQVDDPDHHFDFLGLRMDWSRLQAYISSISGIRMAKMDEFKNSNSAQILNTIVFHTNLVDNMESLLADTSDMSLFYFYPSFLYKSTPCLSTKSLNTPDELYESRWHVALHDLEALLLPSLFYHIP